MGAEHIHYAHLRYGNGIQFRTLRHAGAHQQAAVGAAHDGQVRGTCISLLNQPFGCRDEVVEHILLVHLGARQVPGLAVLAATAEVHLCVYAAPLEEGYACGGESRRQGDVESAVSVQVHGVLPVQFQSFTVGQEHRYAGAVLGREEYLRAFEFRQVEIGAGLFVLTALAAIDIQAVDGAGGGE